MAEVSLGPLFDLASGRELRDKGIEQVTEHNETWFSLCQREAERFAETHETFTGEDIRFHCLQTVGYPKHCNAWGALINSLLKRGIIRATGEHRPMRDEISHARSTPVYQRT
jgi:hypothetical protein